MSERAGDKLRKVAENLQGLQIPAPVRMLLGELDLDGARAVLISAAAQLDRVDDLEIRLAALEEKAAA
jgi:hypothetical protein